VALIKSQLDARVRQGEDGLTLEHRVAEMELSLFPVRRFREGQAFQQHDVPDYFFVGQGSAPEFLQLSSTVLPSRLQRNCTEVLDEFRCAEAQRGQ